MAQASLVAHYKTSVKDYVLMMMWFAFGLEEFYIVWPIIHKYFKKNMSNCDS